MRNRTADLFFDPDTAAPVCGVDEAGRGPLAGPVVAAAVILRPEVAIAGLADSKTLATAERERLYAQIVAGALVGVGAASVAEIDRLNILNATLLAMQRAVGRLPQPPAHALIDGNRPPRLAMPATCIVGGDASEPAIAAASIIAKVTRDRIMHTLAHIHRGYGWETNVGYPTAAHRAALLHLGITRHHRRSFRPVRLVAESAVTL